MANVNVAHETLLKHIHSFLRMVDLVKGHRGVLA